MRKNCNSCGKEQKSIHKSKLHRISVTKCAVFLMAMVMAVIFVPQMPFATTLPEKIESLIGSMPLMTSLPTPPEQTPAEVTPSSIPSETQNPASNDFADADDATDLSREINPNIDNTGYVPWEELTPETQDNLKSIYTDEDLVHMFAPRRWVTLPDVIGMTEAEAVKAFHDKGLTVYVQYGESWNRSYAEGLCYYQDVPAGMRWNTDAVIMIKIQRIEKELEPTVTPAPSAAPTPIPTPTITPEPTGNAQINEPEPTVEPIDVPTEITVPVLLNN